MKVDILDQRITILLIGSSGYLGGQLANEISKRCPKDYILECPSHSQLDLMNKESVVKYFKGKYYDKVINCAAIGKNNINYENRALQQNLTMFYNLLSQQKHYQGLILFGSGAQFLDNGIPKDQYGLSKKIITDLSKQYSFITIFRIWGLFNQNELKSRFIKANIFRYLKKESMIIFKDMIFDFFYMSDLNKLILEQIDNPTDYSDFIKNPINCVYSKKYTLLQIAQIINKLDDYEVKIVIENPYNDNLGYFAVHERGFPDNLISGIKSTYINLKNIQEI